MARKITVNELKRLIEAEMKDALPVDQIKVKQRPWWDVDGVLENEVDWMAALKIREIFAKRLKNNG